MLLSLMIALIVTPWLSLKLLKRHDDDGADQAPATDPSGEGAVAQGNMGPGDTNVAGHLEHGAQAPGRSEEHTSELQSLMRISYAVFCLKKKTNTHLIDYKQQS